MNLYQFLLLENNDQVDLIYNEGVYVGKRSEDGRAIVLYQLHAFYIEIFYYQYRRNIQHFNCFSSTDNLLPYFEELDVQDLIKYAGQFKF